MSELDAAEIKGMLQRGDKQTDLTFFYGVNSGRITEIKDGTKFSDVIAQAEDKLPPKGPYPTIKNLIKNGIIEI